MTTRRLHHASALMAEIRLRDGRSTHEKGSRVPPPPTSGDDRHPRAGARVHRSEGRDSQKPARSKKSTDVRGQARRYVDFYSERTPARQRKKPGSFRGALFQSSSVANPVAPDPTPAATTAVAPAV